MNLRSTIRRMSAGIAGTAMIAVVLGWAAIRCWSRDPALAAGIVAGGIAGVALVTACGVALGRELATRKTVERGLKKLATIDELTGICNRRGFIEHATGVLELAGRVGRPAVVFLADVDGLKAINDRHGHAAGDLALAAAARILQLTFRSSDVIARIGGDEFAVLALVDSRDGGDGIVPRLRKNIDFWNGRSNQPFAVSLSFGAVAIDPSEDRLDEILSRADRDLYEKKGFRRPVIA